MTWGSVRSKPVNRSMHASAPATPAAYGRAKRNSRQMTRKSHSSPESGAGLPGRSATARRNPAEGSAFGRTQRPSTRRAAVGGAKRLQSDEGLKTVAPIHLSAALRETVSRKPGAILILPQDAAVH